MRILALDLSKRSAGWAVASPADATLASGAWELGSEYTKKGRTFGRLHEEMSGIHMLGAIDAVFYEKPLDLGVKRDKNGKPLGISSEETHQLLMGLAMHAESWGDAMGCRIVRPVPMGTWRRHFLRPNKVGKETRNLKELAVARCRELGYRTQSHDQAEAIGILSYAFDSLGLAVACLDHAPLISAFG